MVFSELAVCAGRTLKKLKRGGKERKREERRGRDEETKRQREEKRKRQRDKKTKRGREEERKGQRDEGTKRLRDEGTKRGRDKGTRRRKPRHLLFVYSSPPLHLLFTAQFVQFVSKNNREIRVQNSFTPGNTAL